MSPRLTDSRPPAGAEGTARCHGGSPTMRVLAMSMFVTSWDRDTVAADGRHRSPWRTAGRVPGGSRLPGDGNGPVRPWNRTA